MSLSILAVCAGNICRSPAAEAAIQARAAEAGLDVLVDSAGTGTWNIGESPAPESIAAAKRKGLDVTGRARRVNSADFARFDMILAMDRSNLRDLRAMAPNLEAQAKLRLFRTYDASSEEEEIPDPFGGSDGDYDRALDHIMASAAGLDSELTASRVVEDAIPLE